MITRYPRPSILATIPFGCHGVIEASAGTGKTYTIEHLVVDLILRTNSNLENILVVTFTDKATKELKTRIRQLIEKVLNSNDTIAGTSENEDVNALDLEHVDWWHIDHERRSKLEAQLFAFDLAPIHTIHGFCRRVLMELAFDTRQPIDQTRIDGTEAFDTAWRDSLRTHFLVNSDSAEILRNWLNTGKTIDELRDLLLGAHRHGYLDHYSDTAEVADALVARIAVGLEDNWYIDQLARLSIRKEAIGAATNTLTDLRECFQASNGHPTIQDLARLDLAPLTHVAQVFTQNPTLRFPDGLSVDGRRWLDDLRSIRKTCLLLHNDEQTYVDAFLPTIVSRLEKYKKTDGLFEFDDLLTQVSDVLQGPQHDRLLNILRNRFSHALIDEFQDTDARQWLIFHRIFVEDDGGCLYVIGDPKQAIYGFRGADIHTYMSARNTLLSLPETPDEPVSLDTNFRSTAALIESINLLLNQDDEAPFLSGAIQYTNPVSCGRTKMELRDVNGDAIPPVTRLRYRPKPRKRRQKHLSGWSLMRIFADETVRQLRRLLGRTNTDSQFVISDGTTSRPVQASDVYILVRTRREATFIAEVLRENQFNCVLQQTTNVFRTEAARAIRNLLSAIEQPGQEDRRMTAFAGPFFSTDWQTLVGYRNCPDDHPYVQLLYRWNQLMTTGRISEAFRSIQVDSGFIPRLLLNANREQLRMNVAHVFEALVEVIGISKPSIREVIATLEMYMSGYDGGADGPMTTQRLAGVGDAIQVMTIHKSKGLEAKCIFLFGGFLESWRPPVQSFRYHGANRVLVGREACDAFRTQLEHQAQQEDQRLYYVGLTRAGAKLFLPEVVSDIPIAGPYKVVNDRLCTLANREELNESLFEIIDVQENSTSHSEQYRSTDTTPWTPPEEKIQVVRCDRDDVPWANLRERSAPLIMTSYSALKKAEYTSTQDDLVREEEDTIDTIVPSTNIDTSRLPGGRHMGRCLHEAIELVSLTGLASIGQEEWASDSENLKLFDRVFRRHGIDIAYRQLAQKIVYRALTRRFVFGDDSPLPPLCSVDGRREVEFLFPLPEVEHPLLNTERSSNEGWHLERGLVKGFIDFVFIHKGKLFWIDWKSDVLSSYDQAHIQSHVDGHYDLQASLYTLSCCRILGIRTQADYEMRFGGLAYVFLRGIHDDERPKDGIYFERPLWQDIVAFEQSLITDTRLPMRVGR